MKKILLTGFEPFSDIAINPSEGLVRDLHFGFKSRLDIQSDMLILPVDYEKAGAVIAALDFTEYDFVFQFGVASGRTKISLERVALNWIESSIPDNSGRNYIPQKISLDTPEALFNSLDLARLHRQLNDCFENSTEVSFTAGAYLCNYVYYKTLFRTQNCLFVHIPLDRSPDLTEFAEKLIELVFHSIAQ